MALQIVAATVGTLAGTVLAAWFLAWRRSDLRSHGELLNEGRRRIISRLGPDWIDPVLEQARWRDRDHQPLSLSLAPAWRLVDVTGARPIRRQMPVDDLIAATKCRFLIVGVPGSGKSVLLAQIAARLRHDAEVSADARVPVVFSFGSYPGGLLEDWMATELVTRYGSGSRAARALIDSDAIAPLFDGLDEAPPVVLGQAIRALRLWTSSHSGGPVIVACRTAEYERLVGRARTGTATPHLGHAVEVLPLTEAVVAREISRLANDRPGAGWLVSSVGASVREVARTPLYLDLLLDAGLERLRGVAQSHEDIRRHLLNNAIDRASETIAAENGFQAHQCRRWLELVAHRIQASDDRSVFFLHQLWEKIPRAFELAAATLVAAAILVDAVLVDDLIFYLLFIPFVVSWWNLRPQFSGPVFVAFDHDWRRVRKLVVKFGGLGGVIFLVLAPGMITAQLVLDFRVSSRVYLLYSAALFATIYAVTYSLYQLPFTTIVGVPGRKVIQRSARTAVGSAVLVALVIPVLLLLYRSIASVIGALSFRGGPPLGLVLYLELTFGVGLTLWAALNNGGWFVLCFYWTEHRLARSGLGPRRLVPVLEVAADAGIVRRSGSGWAFRHREIQELLAGEAPRRIP